ncbi:MAG: hypothetical protein ACPGVB_14655, partial [Chitinophagales bacterium]
MSEKTNKLPVYTFSSFTESMATKAFNLKQQLNVDGYLSDWLERAKAILIEEYEEKRLVQLNRKLQLSVRGWNEQELREKFISPVVELVDFDLYSLEIFSFAEREMKVIYNKNILQGKVEWMVAKGVHT